MKKLIDYLSHYWSNSFLHRLRNFQWHLGIDLIGQYKELQSLELLLVTNLSMIQSFGLVQTRRAKFVQLCLQPTCNKNVVDKY